jgi:uncharacterized membrane protein
MTRNIPLNNQLAKIDVNRLSEPEADRIRKEFQGPGAPWMRFHTVRTLAAITAAAILFGVSLQVRAVPQMMTPRLKHIFESYLLHEEIT